MFCLWMSLICAAALIQSVSSDEKGVNLNCSKPVEVLAGDTVTLKCSVYYNIEDSDCEVVQVIWSNTGSKIPCDSGSSKYICYLNHQTRVLSLIISNVVKEENYTVTVETDCGDDTSMINVQVKPPDKQEPENTPDPGPKADQVTRAIIDKQGPGDGPGSEQDVEPNTNIIAFSGICVVVIVTVMLFVLFKTNSHRKIIKCIKGEKTQDYSQTAAEFPFVQTFLPLYKHS